MVGVLWVGPGCAWKGEGLVAHHGLGTTVTTPTGGRLKLVLGESDRALAHLDGHLVMLEGRRAFGSLRVTDWSVPEGTHGMAAWVGRLERRGVQLGLQDRNSGAYYLLDSASWPVLSGAVGQEVLVEGYVDGPHEVKVMFYRVLAKQP